MDFHKAMVSQSQKILYFKKADRKQESAYPAIPERRRKT